MADPKAKGVICGLTLDTSEKHLALLYLATIQGIAYGTRHIVEHCNAHGHKVLICSQWFNHLLGNGNTEVSAIIPYYFL
jgi:glycerol kinase